MAVAERQSEPVCAGDYEDLRRRLIEVERKQAAADKKQAEDATVLAKIEAQIPFLATKEDVATLDKKIEVGLANIMTLIAKLETQIAKMETRNEKNSKNNIMWIVGTGIALAAVIFAAPMLSAG